MFKVLSHPIEECTMCRNYLWAMMCAWQHGSMKGADLARMLDIEVEELPAMWEKVKDGPYGDGRGRH